MGEERTRLPWVERIAESFPPIRFADFHRVTLGDLVARDAGQIDEWIAPIPPLAFRTESGQAFCWSASPGGLRISPGTDGAHTVVELNEATFGEHIHQLLTAVGATQTGRARIVQGSLDLWQQWEPAIRSLVDGMPIYGAHVRETLVDRQGALLPLDKSFAPDDPLDEMAHYFRVMGYLHIRAVFSPDEVAILRDEVESCRAGSVPGDPKSWWSVNSRGEELVTRINHCERFSAKIAYMAHDSRLARYAGLVGPHLRVCDDRLDGPMVFIKHPDVVKGLGDLWWHVDDGIGGTPVMNPLIQAGIQLDRANADNGQVLMLAGSHRYNKRTMATGDEGDLPIVPLVTEPGDLTLHYGATMHCTPAPTSHEAGRRVLYYKFAEPKTFSWIPSNCHYNDALFGRNPQGENVTHAQSAY